MKDLSFNRVSFTDTLSFTDIVNKSNRLLGVDHKPGFNSALSHLVLKTTLRKVCFCLKFSEKETEAKKGSYLPKVAWPVNSRGKMGTQVFRP